MIKQEYDILKKIGKRFMIHAYKFNGWLYRTWEYPMIIDNTDDYVVLSNFDTKILTGEFQTNRVFGSETKHPSFWVFFKKHWFNLLVSIVDNKPQYYINVSSVFIYEESAIKYIDFDLDYKIQSNGNWIELDKKEFEESKERFRYPNSLVNIIRRVEKQIEDLINKKYFQNTFNIDLLNQYIQIYKEYENKEEALNEQ